MLTFKQFLHEQNTTERKSAMDKAIERQAEKMRKEEEAEEKRKKFEEMKKASKEGRNEAVPTTPPTKATPPTATTPSTTATPSTAAPTAKQPSTKSEMLTSMRETTPISVSSIVPSGNAMYGVQDVARNRETIIGAKQPSISLSASPSLGKYSSTYRL